MKRLPPLPRGQELGLFALVAVVCATLAVLFRSYDLVMAAMALPIFILAAWMGMRRSGQWASITADTTPTAVPEPENEELAV